MVHSHSTGAIGVLGVKKSVDGVWLYFAHNTDSFVRLIFFRSSPADTVVGCGFDGF